MPGLTQSRAANTKTLERLCAAGAEQAASRRDTGTPCAGTRGTGDPGAQESVKRRQKAAESVFPARNEEERDPDLTSRWRWCAGREPGGLLVPPLGSRPRPAGRKADGRPGGSTGSEREKGTRATAPTSQWTAPPQREREPTGGGWRAQAVSPGDRPATGTATQPGRPPPRRTRVCGRQAQPGAGRATAPGGRQGPQAQHRAHGRQDPGATVNPAVWVAGGPPLPPAEPERRLGVPRVRPRSPVGSRGRESGSHLTERQGPGRARPRSPRGRKAAGRSGSASAEARRRLPGCPRGLLGGRGCEARPLSPRQRPPPPSGPGDHPCTPALLAVTCAHLPRGLTSGGQPQTQALLCPVPRVSLSCPAPRCHLLPQQGAMASLLRVAPAEGPRGEPGHQHPGVPSGEWAHSSTNARECGRASPTLEGLLAGASVVSFLPQIQPRWSQSCTTRAQSSDPGLGRRRVPGAGTWVTGLLRATARLPLGLSRSHAGHRHKGDGLALLGQETGENGGAAGTPGALAVSGDPRGRHASGPGAGGGWESAHRERASGTRPGPTGPLTSTGSRDQSPRGHEDPAGHSRPTKDSGGSKLPRCPRHLPALTERTVKGPQGREVQPRSAAVTRCVPADQDGWVRAKPEALLHSSRGSRAADVLKAASPACVQGPQLGHRRWLSGTRPHGPTVTSPAARTGLKSSVVSPR